MKACSDKVQIFIGLGNNRTGLSWFFFFYSRVFLVLKRLKTYSETQKFKFRTVMMTVCSFRRVCCSVRLDKQDAFFKVSITFLD